jgi:hypothetical protein
MSWSLRSLEDVRKTLSPAARASFRAERLTPPVPGDFSINREIVSGADTLNQNPLPNAKPLHRSPSSDTRARNNTSLSPIKIPRKLAHNSLIKNNIIRQHTVLVRRKPRARRFLSSQILRVDDGSDSVLDIQRRDLLAFGNNFSGCVIARDAVGDDRPGIAAVGDVGVAVVKRDGVDFDEDLCGF